jgi:hypothetical protein
VECKEKGEGAMEGMRLRRGKRKEGAEFCFLFFGEVELRKSSPFVGMIKFRKNVPGFIMISFSETSIPKGKCGQEENIKFELIDAI